MIIHHIDPHDGDWGDLWNVSFQSKIDKANQSPEKSLATRYNIYKFRYAYEW